MRPDAGKGRRQAAHLRRLLRIEHMVAVGAPGLIVVLSLLQVVQFVIPSRFQGLRHVPQGRSHRHQATSGHIGFILRPLHLPVPQLLGFPSPIDHLWLHRQGGLHGQRGHLLEQDRADHGLDCAAWDGGTEGHTRIELGVIARIDGIATSARVALVGGGHVASARTTQDDSLKHGGALTRRTVGVMAEVAWQAFLVGLALRPTAVARMGALDSGMPVVSVAFPLGGPAPWTVPEARATLGKGAGRARMMQDTPGQPTRECRPPHCAAVRALDRTGGALEPLPVAVLHHPDRGADVSEGVEKQPARCLYVLIRIAYDLTGWRRDKADGQLGGPFAPSGLMASATLEACPHGQELRLGHGPLQTENQPIVALAQSIHRLGIADQGLMKTTKLQQLLEVGIVAGQA
jgi:hypothetical protein